jgi:hypothetical protein
MAEAQSQSNDADRISWSDRSLRLEDAKAFVGPRFERYWYKWRMMATRGSALSWNWASALLGPAWFGFRRMHGYAILLILAYTVLGFSNGVVGPTIAPLSLILSIGVVCLVGMVGNAAYRSFALRRIGEVRSSAGNDDERHGFLRARGGTSWGFGIVWCLLAAAFPTAGAIVGALILYGPEGSALVKGPQQRQSLPQQSPYAVPVVIDALSAQGLDLARVPEAEQAPAVIYLATFTHIAEEACGEFLTFPARLTLGVAEAAIGVSLLLSANPNGTSPFHHLMKAGNAVGSLQMAGKQDAVTFLQSHGCTSPQTFAMQRNLNATIASWVGLE